jgi:hypothetical protein
MKLEYVEISPMNINLDIHNPRYLKKIENEKEMIEYLLEYEDCLDVALSISKVGLTAGDIPVGIKESDVFTVIEGNRRIASMKMFLNRDIIPTKFRDKIPIPEESVIDEIIKITIQVIETRREADRIMADRHISGIKQWKPLAKKNFFSSRFENGQTVEEMSIITNISESEIRGDIRDYKFLMSNLERYNKSYPNNQLDVLKLEIDRFLRVFTTFVKINGANIGGRKLLKMSYDDCHNVQTELKQELFDETVSYIFGLAFVEKTIDTRTKFGEIPGIEPYIKRILDEMAPRAPEHGNEDDFKKPKSGGTEETVGIDTPKSIIEKDNNGNQEKPEDEVTLNKTKDDGKTNKKSGGEPPNDFFGTLAWENKLSNSNPEHEGLLKAAWELYNVSHDTVRLKERGNAKSVPYERYSISSGMLIRSAYEQALILLIKENGKWDTFMKKYPDPHNRTLSALESFVGGKDFLPTGEIIKSLNAVKRSECREILNDNTHNINLMSLNKLELERIAKVGMKWFIQEVINSLPETQ